MTQEDKELLLKDLCARLPYGVRIKAYGDNNSVLTGEHYDLLCTLNNIESLPYLRSMSSMTEEEIVELKWLNEQCDAMPTFEYVPIENYRIYDWMNRHHFDYRNLIEKGLAIEVTENNNPYKEYNYGKI